MPRFALLVGAFVLASLPSANAFGQSYPTRPIKIVVQAPGGPTDNIGRIIGPKLAAILNQPVVIENRGGAGGTIGAESVVRAPADGYTLLIGGSSTLVIGGALAAERRYDAFRDFVPIGGMAIFPNALAVNPKVPVTTVSELIAYARVHPGRLTYGSSGVGGMTSLAVEWLKAATGVEIVHVPYRGSAPAVMALLSGEIDLLVADLSLLTPHAKTGTLRLVAAAGARRASAAPDLPTVAEQGIPGFAIEWWTGMVAPAGTPPEVLAKLSSALNQALRAPDVTRRFEELGYEPIVDTPAAFEALIRSDVERYATVIKRTGIRVEP